MKNFRPLHKDFHVIRRPDGWVVKAGLTSRPLALFDRKDDAIRDAEARARDRGRAVVHALPEVDTDALHTVHI